MSSIGIELILDNISFFTLNNANIQLTEKELTWKFSIIAKALPITKRMKLINKKNFTKTVLDKDSKTFLVHIAALNALLAEIIVCSL